MKNTLRRSTSVGLSVWAVGVVLCLVLAFQAKGQGATEHWPPGGLRLTSVPGGKPFVIAVPCSGGGAYVVWQDGRQYYSGRHFWDIYAQRVSPDGRILWQANGIPVSAGREAQMYPVAVADGQGGVIIVWEDWRGYFQGRAGDVYAQRLDSTGTPLWREGGLAVCAEMRWQQPRWILPDGAGGAIFFWYDERSEEPNIYAQRVSAAGDLLWQEGGVPVCPAPGLQEMPTAVPDGSGGAIVAWFDMRHSPGSFDVYAQRIDSTGTPQWDDGGVWVGEEVRIFDPIFVVSDQRGGIMIFWAAPDGCRGQRLDGSGRRLWGDEGLVVFPPPSKGAITPPYATSDGEGGALVVQHWDALELRWGNYVAKLTPEGTPAWREPARMVRPAWRCDPSQEAYTSDGHGGVVGVWPCYMDSATTYDVFACKVDSAGTLSWGSTGVVVCRNPGADIIPDVTADGEGGVYVVWVDLQAAHGDSEVPPPPQIYIQRVYADGRVGGTQPSGVCDARPIAAASLEVEQNYPNPFNQVTTITFKVGGTAKQHVHVSVFDVTGKEVRVLFDGLAAPGVHRVLWDGTDEQGRPVASGVYLYGLARGTGEMRKLVLLR